MKAVMISIQPKWCELIANGEKTIEVRKTKPNAETPFKCYIYCTFGKGLIGNNDKIMPNFLFDRTINKFNICGNCCNGKVIGEFVCDVIDKIYVMPNAVYCGDSLYGDKSKEMCLTDHDLANYLGYDFEGRPNFGYAWHITDLKIYDEPKEIGAFRRISPYCEYQKNHRVERCEKCDKRNVACIQYNCECWTNKNGKAIIKDRRITRPPQSWCYCEETAISKIETTTKGEKK